MLEVNAHNYVKRVVKKNNLQWAHHLTLTRLVSRSLRCRDQALIHIQNSHQEDWWLGILAPLCLDAFNATLLLSERHRRQFLQIEVPKLKREGLDLLFSEGSKPPLGEEVWLLEYGEIVEAYRKGWLTNRYLIVPEAEYLTCRLRDQLSIEITSEDWDDLIRNFSFLESSIIQIYERISRRLFSLSRSKDEIIRTDLTQIKLLKDLFTSLPLPASPWGDIFNTIDDGWASWAQLDTEMFKWTLHFQPLEPLKIFSTLWYDNPFLMITDSRQSKLFISELKAVASPMPIQFKIGSVLNQDPIPLFVPSRQPLPNNPIFYKYVLDQCRRLIIGRAGMTIILLNDLDLLRQLTSELAADFGLRVAFQELPRKSNGIICCSCEWWIDCQRQLPLPEQLIFPLVPFPSLSSPLTAAKVESCKQLGRDWFREFLLPETLRLFLKAVAIIRGKNIRLSILDGRIRFRSWGEQIFQTLEPWTPLERLLPD